MTLGLITVLALKTRRMPLPGNAKLAATAMLAMGWTQVTSLVPMFALRWMVRVFFLHCGLNWRSILTRDQSVYELDLDVD